MPGLTRHPVKNVSPQATPLTAPVLPPCSYQGNVVRSIRPVFRRCMGGFTALTT